MTKIFSPNCLAKVSLISSALCVLALLSLHLVSPELDPSWRMISEYAYGDYSWLLSGLFILWSLSSLALVGALWPTLQGKVGKIGLVLLFIAGLGELMAAFFDITQPLHGVAFPLGIGGFLLASPLITWALFKSKTPLKNKGLLIIVAFLPWVSLVLMGVEMATLISSVMKAGVDMSQPSSQITSLPAGITTNVGWANRFVVLTFNAWVFVVAGQLLSVSKTKK